MTKLLVVDDEPGILTAIQDLFEDDFDVLKARGAEEALKIITDQNVTVILSDERMPGLSGYRLLAQIKRISPAIRILVTGYMDIDALTQAINEAEIYAYVTKPWDPAELRITVTRAVNHHNLIAEVNYERDLLRSLMEGTPDPICFKDRDSRCTRVNQAQASIFGVLGPEQCIGKQDSDFLPAIYAREAYEDEKRVMESGKALIGKIEKLQKPDGSVSWFSTVKVPLRGKDGLVNGLAGISRNITDLKSTEEALRVAHDKVHLILYAAGDGICGLDSEGRITFANPAGARMTGWEVEDLTGKPMTEIARHWRAPGAPDAADSILVNATQQESPYVQRGGGDFLKKDGASFPAEYTISSFGMNGARAAVITFEDVTERKLVELTLQRSIESAVAANRAKSEFLAKMSHEIRTPMNAISGLADVLWESPLNPEQRECVTIFRHAGANLLTIINNILDLSKIESGMVELDVVEFSLAATMEETRTMMAGRAKERGLEFSNHILPGVPNNLVGDAGRLQQILINLIGNAVKFTSSGKIEVRVERNPEGRNPGSLKFAVSDTGVGIPAGKLDAIFENFTQADSSIARDYGGTGLGLAICRKLIALLDGRIWVESELGRGSTFYFTAEFGVQPARASSIPNEFDSSRQAIEAPWIGGEDGPVLRILVADDLRDNLFLVRTYLKNSRFHIDEAESGEIALSKFKISTYDLVLIDIRMPGMDGYAATRSMREWERENGVAPTPILALTADAGEEYSQDSLNAGCTAHLTKPIRKGTLLEAIGKHAKTRIGDSLRHDAAEGLEDLIPEFLENRQKDLLLLQEALGRTDFNSLGRVGHRLKGTGTGYGFPGITEIGGLLEGSAGKKNIDEARKQVIALADYLSRVKVSHPA